MKSGHDPIRQGQLGQSHPAWDAWIEISPATRILYHAESHPAWDAWIEIAAEFPSLEAAPMRRIPHGMRGLK